MRLSTVVNLPYTISTSSSHKGMKLYCEYDTDKKENTNVMSAEVSSAIYSGEYEGPETDSIVIRTSPNKFNKYALDKAEKTINYTYKFNVWFPVEQLSTYYKRYNLYHVFIYTYVNDVMCILYSGIIDSMNNLPGVPFINGGVRYQEYQTIPLVYTSAGQVIEYTSQLYISINSVYADGDVYYTNPNTFPGASFISSNQAPITLSLDEHETSTNGFSLKINNIIGTFPTYIKNKYFGSSTNHTLLYRLMVVDKYNEEVVYSKLANRNWGAINQFSITYTEAFPDEGSLKIISPDLTYPEGLQVVVIIEAYNGTITPEDVSEDIPPVISIISNSLMLSEHIWGQMRAALLYNFSSTALKKRIDDMSTIVNVKNIIETKTIKVNQNTTEGVIKPVFYKAYPLGEAVLHKDIKENILINLDGYLSQVSKFYIKINGNIFAEYARVYDGVVFTVDGLSGEDGVFYVLDEDKKLVTSGKFTFEV